MYAQGVVNDRRRTESKTENTSMTIRCTSIILARTPCLRTRARRPIRVLGYCAFDVLERKLALELCLKGRKRRDEFRACLFEHCLRGDGAIRLNFEKEIRVEWVWHSVACKEDLGASRALGCKRAG